MWIHTALNVALVLSLLSFTRSFASSEQLKQTRNPDGADTKTPLHLCASLFGSPSFVADCQAELHANKESWATQALASMRQYTADRDWIAAAQWKPLKTSTIQTLKPALPDFDQVPKDLFARAQFLFSHGYRQAAVLELCTDSAVRIDASDRFDLSAIMNAAVVIEVCGFVLLRNMYSRELAHTLSSANRRHFWTFYNSTIAPHAELADAESFETDEFAIRSRGRFEYKLPLEAPFTSPHMLGSPFLRGALSASMLSSNITLDTFSCVVSLPDTPVQHWHADASALFTHPLNTPASDLLRRQRLDSAARQGLPERDPHWAPAKANTHPRWGYFDAASHLPPHGIVLFVPLINVTRAMGPTEMRPGTHLVCPPDHKTTHDIGQMQLPACPEHSTRTIHATADLGDAILFDFRISHRGGRNSHRRRERPQIYMTFLKDWYYDAVNFHSMHSRWFDELPPYLRKLTTRLDSAKFTRDLHHLEAELT